MVYVFLADGFEEVEAMTPIDYMRRAGIKVTTVGVGTAVPKGSHGVSVMADISEDMFYPDDNTEAIVLPGGAPGYVNLGASEAVRRAIRLGYGETDVLIGAICAAPVVLAKEGLLQEKRATCYPDKAEELGIKQQVQLVQKREVTPTIEDIMLFVTPEDSQTEIKNKIMKWYLCKERKARQIMKQLGITNSKYTRKDFQKEE